MRKRVLGTIAAFTVGAGAAFAQSPQATVPPPSALGPVAGLPGGFQPASGASVNEIVAPPVGGFGGFGPLGPGGPPGDPAAMGPMIPPGIHGQPQWDEGFSGASSPAASKIYLNSRLLLWFVKAQPTNIPYVSTSAPQDAGLAGQPTTTLLHSRSDLGYNVFAGFHINGGYFCDTDRRVGIDIGGMLFERKSNVFFASSDANGIPVLARPFVDASTGGPAVLTVSQQGLASGSILVSSLNEMYGAEASLLVNLYRSCPDDARRITIDGTLGFRFFELHEDIRIASQSTILGNGAPLFNGAAIFNPAIVSVTDSFNVFNRFYGGQVGMNATSSHGRWNFGLSGKIAAGVMNQVLDVDGRSDLLDLQRGLFAQAIGGVFANAQNMGRYRNDEFAIIPEVGTSLGYNWTSWFSTSIGYNYLYINRVLRPGNVISNRVNPAIIPTSQSFGAGGAAPVQPQSLAQDEYWAQGVTFSMLFRY